MKIGIIIGSTRPGRVGEGIGTWVQKNTVNRQGVAYEIVDLAEVDLPLYNESQHPAMGQYDHEHTKAWGKLIDQFDGYVIVTPEYNNGYPASLKNALDYIYNEWANKPVAFVSYGGVSAGTRAVQQLKQVAVELHLAPIRNGVYIPYVASALNIQGEPADSSYAEALEIMFNELEAWAKALQPLRASFALKS